MDILIAVIVMIVGYGIAFFFLFRTYMYVFSLGQKTPYGPIDKKVLEEAIKYLDLKPGDRFIDIGSGDGRVLFELAKRFGKEVSYTGVETVKPLHIWATVHKMFDKNKDSIHFINNDVFKEDLSDFNKVYLYITSDLFEDLVPKLEEEIKKGSTVVICVFSLPEGFDKIHDIKEYPVKIKNKTRKLFVWKK